MKKREEDKQKKANEYFEKAKASWLREEQRQKDADEAPALRAQVDELKARLAMRPALNTRVIHPVDSRFRDDQVRVLNEHVIDVDFGYEMSGVLNVVDHLSAVSVTVSLCDDSAMHVNKDTRTFTVCADVPIIVAVVAADRGATVLVAPDPGPWWHCASCGAYERGTYPRGCFGDQPCVNVTRIGGRADAK